jgi:hypothetical protein
LFVYIIIISVFKYISEKEKSTYDAEPSKLYGTFVSSSKKQTEPENPPALVRIHPHLIAEDVSVVVVVEVMMVLALVVHCLMLLVYILKIICP